MKAQRSISVNKAGQLIIIPVMRERVRVVQEEEDGYLIPQWLIAVIVIGLASLLFILIFGITVVSMNVMTCIFHSLIRQTLYLSILYLSLITNIITTLLIGINLYL